MGAKKGQKRPDGAGRKAMYSEPTKVKAFRIPESHVPRITKIVETELSKLKITTK